MLPPRSSSLRRLIISPLTWLTHAPADCGTPIQPNGANLCVNCLRNSCVFGNCTTRCGDFADLIASLSPTAPANQQRRHHRGHPEADDRQLLPRLRALPLAAGSVDPLRTRVARTARNLPPETQGPFKSPTHRCRVHLDRAAFKAIACQIDHPERGALLRRSSQRHSIGADQL